MEKPKHQNKTIPKASFSNILKNALDNMDNFGDKNCIAKNLVSAFRATGIYPLCKEQVLSKLPNDVVNTEVLSDTLTEYLKSQRYGSSDENARKQRKKLYVPPGTSITAASIGLEKENTAFDDRTSENIALTLDHESYHEVHKEVDVPEYTKPSDDNLKIGSFVLVNVLSGKRKSTYFVHAAVIQNVEHLEYRVVGLKAIDTTR